MPPTAFRPAVALLLVLTLMSGCVRGPRTPEPGGGPRPFPPPVQAAVDRGAKALLDRVHDTDGSWGGDDVKIASSHKSDYPVAISSLACLALMATRPDDPASLQARERALTFILDTIRDDGTMANTRDNTPKVHERNVWSQAFALLYLGRATQLGALPRARRAAVRAEMTAMVEALCRTQQKDGGWTYDKGPSESFTTATVLHGLLAAREAGISVEDAVLERSCKLLGRQSNPGQYVAYQGVPRKQRRDGRVRDSIGRSVQLQLVLLLAGRGTRADLETALDTFFQYRERFDKVRDLEEGCHQKPHGIGTFYCFYGYFYVAQALACLGGPVEEKYGPALTEHFLRLQKDDGHWLDSRDHCGESYGTAMALLILAGEHNAE